MKYKGIIFDLDGVITSTDDYHYKAWKALADSLGIYFDRKINNRLRGVSRMESLDIILENSDKDYSQAEKEEFAAKKNEQYRNYLLEMSPADLKDEVKQTLNKLRDLGLKLAVGSSSKNAPLILKQIGLGDFFDAVSDGNNIKHSKPNPEVFLKAAEMLDLEPEDCMVIEDAESGLEAANKGGFTAVGYGAAEQSSKADIHLENFADLVEIVQE